MTATTCCQCSGDMTAGGIYYGGDERHQEGGYCVCCAEIVAFWPCIDGEDHELITTNNT